MNNEHIFETGGSFSHKGNAGADMVYKIGDLAREFGVTLRTLRFYEDRGLITPNRSGTTRLYSPEDRQRLQVALFGKRIGLSLGEIQNILELHEKHPTDRTASKKLLDIYAAQLKDLQQKRVETDATINDLEMKLAELRNNS